MVLTADDIAAITQIVNQVTQASRSRDRGRQEREEGSWGHKEILDAKKTSLIDKFIGGEAKYRDWAQSFKGAIRIQSGKLVRLMEKVETNEDMTTEKAVEMMEFDEQEKGGEGDSTGWTQVVGELYCWLDLLTTGEARAVVRSEDEGDGIKAWGRIHRQYNRRTISRLDEGPEHLHVPQGSQGA